MKKISIIFLFIMTLSVNPVHSKTTNYLMKEPLTMFEWGIYLIENDINEYFGNLLIEQNNDLEESKKENSEFLMDFSDFYTNVFYDWGENKIKICIVLINEDKNLTITSKAQFCRDYTDSVKKHFYTTQDKEFRKEFGISKFFKHKHFNKNNKPDNFIDSIENIVQIRIDIQYTKDIFALKESGYKIVTSESPLMVDYVLFKETTDDKNDATKK